MPKFSNSPCGRYLRVCAALFIGVWMLPASPQDAPLPGRPVLLELFTSESCSSCPPADAYIGTMVGRTDVLPLTFHVDYWNDLGWTDRLSKPEFTERQRYYASKLGSNVFTPQLVIDGRGDEVGSDRARIGVAIKAAQAAQTRLSVNIQRSQADLRISIGDAPSGTSFHAKILLISFDSADTAIIHAGENGGRTINYFNVARSIREIGSWQSKALQQSATLTADEGGRRVAILVQDRDGIILGLAVSE